MYVLLFSEHMRALLRGLEPTGELNPRDSVLENSLMILAFVTMAKSLVVRSTLLTNAPATAPSP
jgi:hypothetical protein